MSEPFDLNRYVHARFREAFGYPHLAQGKDDQWSIAPGFNRPHISVLLNGTTQGTTLWVFDPHAGPDGAFSTLVKSKSEVDGLIARIQQQVLRAGSDAAAPEPSKRRRPGPE